MALNLSKSLETALPGFGRNSKTASNLVRELMSGTVTKGERDAITNYGAERATAGGMPGSTGIGGSLFANNDLRNIGLASGARQQQGIQDFLSLLTGVSGTVVPTAGQELADQQFSKDLGFRQGEANRNFGLRQNEQDLAAAQFNERYGPKFYGVNAQNPISKKWETESGYWANDRGQRASGPAALMFKYKR